MIKILMTEVLLPSARKLGLKQRPESHGPFAGVLCKSVRYLLQQCKMICSLIDISTALGLYLDEQLIILPQLRDYICCAF